VSSPLVSIVVPVYNGERTIEACIKSIIALSFPRDDFELLLIDNASTDRTASILERYRDHAVVLHETMRGPAAARNRGLSNAKGDVVAFTDADCIVDSNWLSRVLAPLDDPSVGIVGGTIRSVQPSNAISEFGERIHDHQLAIEYYTPPYAITMNWASPRSVLEKVGYFDESLLRCEDCDLSFRIVAAGYRIVHEPTAVVYHRNEHSLGGLIAEGYAHGLHSIRLLAKHEEFVRTFVAAEPRAAQPASRPASRDEAFYWRIFNLGKTAGKAAGSLRRELGKVSFIPEPRGAANRKSR
jgi:glycosyltransferase involved in cell wall biosynthesis